MCLVTAIVWLRTLLFTFTYFTYLFTYVTYLFAYFSKGGYLKHNKYASIPQTRTRPHHDDTQEMDISVPIKLAFL